MFELSQCTVSIAGYPLIDHLDLRVPPGHRLAVVGQNGSGKSTLLRVLAGVVPPDTGTASRPTGRVAVLPQAADWPTDTTVGAVRQAATAWAEELLAEIEAAGRALAHISGPHTEDRLARALAAAEAHDAWTADGRMEIVAARLGVAIIPPATLVAHLSGGLQRRLQLLGVMVGPAEGYLLDEPTNHLDDHSMQVLTEWLQGLEAPVVFTSHDRTLVEDAATGVLDLDPVRGASNVVPGGWTAYQHHRAQQREQWTAAFQAQRAAVAAARGDLRLAHTARAAPPRRDSDKFIPHKGAQSAQATRGRRARDAHRRLEQLDRDRVPKPPRPLSLRTPDLTRAAAPTGVLLSAIDASVAGRLRATRLEVRAGARLLVTGPNGVGKSTLLAVLAGRLRPSTGQVLSRPGIHVAMLDQAVPDGSTSTTADAWYRARVDADAAGLVTLGLVPPRDVGRPMAQLSVGQRRRVALAVAIARRVDVLLLDEPTDHLSPTLVDELEEALAASSGAIVVASHDRWLRTRWPGDVLELPHRW